MPWIISQLIGGLILAASSLVGRVLIAIGFGFVEYVGLQSMVDSALSEARSYMTGIGWGDLAAWVSLFRFDQHISIITSAIGAKLLLNAMSGGSFKRLRMK